MRNAGLRLVVPMMCIMVCATGIDAASVPPIEPIWEAQLHLQLPTGDPKEPGRAEFEALVKSVRGNSPRVTLGARKMTDAEITLLARSASDGFGPALVLVGVMDTFDKDYDGAVREFASAAEKRNADAEYFLFEYMDRSSFVKKFSRSRIDAKKNEFFARATGDGSALAAFDFGQMIMQNGKVEGDYQSGYLLCSLAVTRGVPEAQGCADTMKAKILPTNIAGVEARLTDFTAHPEKITAWILAKAPPVGEPPQDATGGPSDTQIIIAFRQTVHGIAARVAEREKAYRASTDILDLFGGKTRQNLDDAMVAKINSLADNTVIQVRRKVNYEGVWNIDLLERQRGSGQGGVIKILMSEQGGKWNCRIPELERVTGLNLPTLDQMLGPQQ